MKYVTENSFCNIERFVFKSSNEKKKEKKRNFKCAKIEGSQVEKYAWFFLCHVLKSSARFSIDH